MKIKHFFFLVLVFSLFSQVAQSRSLNSLSYTTLKDTILALEHTRLKSEREIQRLSHSPTAYNKKQRKEYVVFTEYLRFQINNYCDQIRQIYGTDKVQGLPCDNFDGNSIVKVQEQQNEIQTSDEQIENLEDEFMASLGEFDDMLLKEEEELAQTSRKQNSASDSGGIGGNGSDSSGSQGNGSNNKLGTDSQSNPLGQNSNESSDSTGNKKQGQYNTRTQAGSARTSGGGQGKSNKTGTTGGKKTSEQEKRRLDEINDDIVARQLKEAAEKETDPQLKEKLWEEYYKYKKTNL